MTISVNGSAWTTLPRLMNALANYNLFTAPMITILGIGNSVAAGATLPNPAIQAPVAYFTSQLKKTIDPLNLVNFAVVNDSVGGSIVVDGEHNLQSYLAANPTTKVVQIGYGMNEGRTAEFNAGVTFGGLVQHFVSLVGIANGAGADAILMTTPHPLSTLNPWSMPPTIPMNYPYAVAAPVPDASLVPIPANSMPSVDVLQVGTPIPVSVRHYMVNQAIKQAAAITGAALWDVENYWFHAVLTQGEAVLFNSGEFVHPNLLGHQLSFWAAINDILLGLTQGISQTGSQTGIPLGWDSIQSGVAYNISSATSLLTPTYPGLLVMQAYQGGVALDNFTTAQIALNRSTGLAAAISPTITGTAMAPLTLSSGAVTVTPLYANMNIKWTYFGQNPL